MGLCRSTADVPEVRGPKSAVGARRCPPALSPAWSPPHCATLARHPVPPRHRSARHRSPATARPATARPATARPATARPPLVPPRHRSRPATAHPATTRHVPDASARAPRSTHVPFVRRICPSKPDSGGRRVLISGVGRPGRGPESTRIQARAHSGPARGQRRALRRGPRPSPHPPHPQARTGPSPVQLAPAAMTVCHLTRYSLSAGSSRGWDPRRSRVTPRPPPCTHSTCWNPPIAYRSPCPARVPRHTSRESASGALMSGPRMWGSPTRAYPSPPRPARRPTSRSPFRWTRPSWRLTAPCAPDGAPWRKSAAATARGQALDTRARCWRSLTPGPVPASRAAYGCDCMRRASHRRRRSSRSSTPRESSSWLPTSRGPRSVLSSKPTVTRITVDGVGCSWTGTERTPSCAPAGTSCGSGTRTWWAAAGTAPGWC